MNWTSLDMLARIAQGVPIPGEIEQQGLRIRAAYVALTTWGKQAPEGIVNVCALAILGRDYIERIRIDPQALPPRSNARAWRPHTQPCPWIVESISHERPLFSATVELGGYSLDGDDYLIGLEYPDGCQVARRGEFEGSSLVDDEAEHARWTDAATAFLGRM